MHGGRIIYFYSYHRGVCGQILRKGGFSSLNLQKHPNYDSPGLRSGKNPSTSPFCVGKGKGWGDFLRQCCSPHVPTLSGLGLLALSAVLKPGAVEGLPGSSYGKGRVAGQGVSTGPDPSTARSSLHLPSFRHGATGSILHLPPSPW